MVILEIKEALNHAYWWLGALTRNVENSELRPKLRFLRDLRRSRHGRSWQSLEKHIQTLPERMQESLPTVTLPAYLPYLVLDVGDPFLVSEEGTCWRRSSAGSRLYGAQPGTCHNHIYLRSAGQRRIHFHRRWTFPRRLFESDLLVHFSAILPRLLVPKYCMYMHFFVDRNSGVGLILLKRKREV
jgi:hypothetical protein